MKAAVAGENELQRLAELYSLNILDTPEEIEFDEITQLAANICNTPIALVSIIDPQRQWFKSHHGLDARETPRDISFCGHAIQQHEIFEIKDSRQDPRFSDNPLVTGEPHVIFYAGAPLKTTNGFNLGTLCVIDNQPGQLTGQQRQSLSLLARQVVAQFERRQRNLDLVDALNKVSSQAETIKQREESLIKQAKQAMLGQLAGSIAHEINSPLSIIALLNQQLLCHLDDQEAVKLCQQIQSTNNRISGIIKNLLAISKSEQHQQKQNQNLHLLVEQTISIARDTNPRLRIDIKNAVHSDYEIQCYPISLSQLLLNLLSNSIKAISKQPDKWICVDCQVNNKTLIISVIDSGSGIPKDMQPQVFEAFSSSQSGTGLGLYIAQNLAKQHGGELHYLSDAKNTQFNLELPLALAKTTPVTNQREANS